jgi:hypothetical protein
MTERKTSTPAKRPSIRDLQIDRPQSDAMKQRRMPQGRQSKPKRKRGGGMVWLVVTAVLFVFVVVVSLPIIFSDTTIKITPVVTKAVFDNAIFNAAMADAAQDDTAGLLRYSKIEWTASDSKILEPTGREQVEEKASGEIIVYNNYTSKKQRLIKNTRFETADGRVYRVHNSIMVPGKSDDGPGQLTVTVYADEAGERYNLESADLTLPGLKSLPDMYSTIYAKVNVPITGGFKGERAVVSDVDKVAATAELKDKIRETVLSEVSSRIPSDTTYFDSGISIDYADIQESEIDGKVQLTQNADVSVVVFDKRDFATTVSQGVAGNPDKGYPTIRDKSTLIVSIEEQDSQDEDSLPTIKMLINGTADFVWEFDQGALKRDLAGKQREALTTILTGYPTIKEAQAMIRPFWRKKFPSNPDDFTIEVLGVE